jgi:hypothetical protein
LYIRTSTEAPVVLRRLTGFAGLVDVAGLRGFVAGAFFAGTFFALLFFVAMAVS